jgi:hypothetical protein
MSTNTPMRPVEGGDLAFVIARTVSPFTDAAT